MSYEMTKHPTRGLLRFLVPSIVAALWPVLAAASCPDRTFYLGPNTSCTPFTDPILCVPTCTNCDTSAAMVLNLMSTFAGCRSVDIKMWGAGGDVVNECAAHNVGAGGGGGFVEADLNRSALTWGLNLKFVQATQPGNNASTAYKDGSIGVKIAVAGGGGRTGCQKVNGVYSGVAGGGGGGTSGSNTPFALGGQAGTPALPGAGGSCPLLPPGVTCCPGAPGQAQPNGLGGNSGACIAGVQYAGRGGTGYTGGGGGAGARDENIPNNFAYYGAGGGGGANFVTASGSGGNYTVVSSTLVNGRAPDPGNASDSDRCYNQGANCRAGEGETGADHALYHEGMVVVRVSENLLLPYRESGCQTWRVPADVTRATFRMWGGGGTGSATEAGLGGDYETVQVDDLEEDEDVTIYVGGPGQDSFVARGESVLASAASGSTQSIADADYQVATSACGFYFKGRSMASGRVDDRGGPSPVNSDDFYYRWPAGRGASQGDAAQAGLVMVAFKPES